MNAVTLRAYEILVHRGTSIENCTREQLRSAYAEALRTTRKRERMTRWLERTMRAIARDRAA